MTRLFAKAVLIHVTIFVASISYADEFDDLFDDIEIPLEIETIEKKNWSIRGDLESTLIANTHSSNEFFGLSSSKIKLNTQASWDVNENSTLYSDVGLAWDGIFTMRDLPWTGSYQDDTEIQWNIRDLVGRYKWASGSIDFGLQSFAMGKLDALSLVNKVNPVDMSLPGMVDIKDARISLLSTGLKQDFVDNRLSIILLHQWKANVLPINGADFTVPINSFSKNEPAQPWSELSNNGIVLSIEGSLSKLDWAAYYGNLLDVQGYGVMTMAGPEIHYGKQQYVGFGINQVLSSSVIKAELALTQGVKGMSLASNEVIEHNQAQVALGIDQSMAGLGNLTLEWQVSRLLDYQAVLGQDESTHRWAVSYRASALREQLSVSYQFLAFGAKADDGQINKGSLAYKVNDHLNVEGGILAYKEGGFSLLTGTENNDRAYVSGTYFW